MINKTESKKILNTALSRGGDFAEIYMEQRTHNHIVMDDGEIEDVLFGNSRGVGMRVVEDDLIYFLNDNATDFDSLMRLAGELADSVDKSRKTKCRRFRARNTKSPLTIKIYPNDVAVEKKLRKVGQGERAARKYDDRVSQVKVSYMDEDKNIFIANSEGIYDEDRRIRTTYMVQAVARDKGLMYTGLDLIAETRGFEIFKRKSARTMGKEAARVAVLQLDAKPAPAGTYTVVLSSDAGGTMIHEACGHGLEGDFVKEGISVYADKVGQKVASELVTVIDDGTLSGRRGSEKIDDEGEPTSRVTLIKNGVLQGFLHSRKSAHETGGRITGNGRRMNFRHLPIPRMRNTFIKRGKTDPEEIIASVKDGILVSQMGGGQVDIVSGNFVFQVREGYRIKNGKVMEPLRGATLTGNGPRVLEKIDMVGSDLGFSPGTCGKEGQGVPVSDAQPTIRIPEITVGGMVS